MQFIPACCAGGERKAEQYEFTALPFAKVYRSGMTGRLVSCGVLALLFALLALTPAGQRLEREVGLALLYAARGNLPAPDGALVVALDRDSVGWLQRNVNGLGMVSEGLDGCLPPHAREELRRARNVVQLPRALHACLIRRLAERRPRVIVFDINFNAETADDTALADAIREAGNVLLLQRIMEDGVVRLLAPNAPLAEAAAGTVFLQTDGTPARAVTGYPTRHRVFEDLPAMPVEAWRRHAAVAPESAQPPEEFRLVWMYGPAETVPTIPLRRVFETGAAAGFPADLSQHSVFVGASDPFDQTAPDHFRVPVLRSGPEMIGGVEIAATAFLNLLHGHRLTAPSPLATAGIIFLFALAALATAQFVAGKRGLAGVLGLAAAWAAAAVGGFVLARFWLPVFVPVGLVTPVAVLAAFSARYSLARRVVERLAPRPFARALLDRAEMGRDRSRTEDATVIFIDMAGSTALAEQLGEDAFAELMNRFYSVATAAVEANDGMVVDYQGDGILALFSAAVAGPEHAAKACRAARQLSASPARRGTEARTGTSFRLRVGIHSGRVVTGATGAEHRYNFNALGDSVNVAARLQEHGKTLPQDGTDIIVLSDDTRRRASLPQNLLESLGMTELRGRTGRIALYRLSLDRPAS